MSLETLITKRGWTLLGMMKAVLSWCNRKMIEASTASQQEHWLGWTWGQRRKCLAGRDKSSTFECVLLSSITLFKI